MDNETWLIELGDEIIDKKSEFGIEELTDYEKAIYCLWVVDYSIRNSGTLDAVEDLYPEALVEFESLAAKHKWLPQLSFTEIVSNQELYYQNYEALCNGLRSVQSNT